MVLFLRHLFGIHHCHWKYKYGPWKSQSWFGMATTIETEGTWISQFLLKVYLQLQHRGHSLHCVDFQEYPLSVDPSCQKVWWRTQVSFHLFPYPASPWRWKIVHHGSGCDGHRGRGRPVPKVCQGLQGTSLCILLTLHVTLRTELSIGSGEVLVVKLALEEWRHWLECPKVPL